MRLIDADAIPYTMLYKENRMRGTGCEKQGAWKSSIDALPTIEPEQHWIPCSERLPDNDESVLISNSHGVTKAWWNGKFWSSIAVKKYKTVAAWMPLPEPYKDTQ